MNKSNEPFSKDVLTVIFGNLPAKDLGATDQVNKFWRDATRKVLTQRARALDLDLGILKALGSHEKVAERLTFWRESKSLSMRQKYSEIKNEIKGSKNHPLSIMALFYPYAPKMNKDCLEYLNRQKSEYLQLQFKEAAKYGNVEFYNLLSKHYSQCHPIGKKLQNLMNWAAGSNNFAMLEAIKANYQAAVYDQRVFDVAHGSGSISMVKILKAKNPELKYNFGKAAASGNVDLVVYLVDECNVNITSAALTEAILISSDELVEFLCKRGAKFDKAHFNEREGDCQIIYSIERSDYQNAFDVATGVKSPDFTL